MLDGYTVVEDGFAVVPGILEPGQAEVLATALQPVPSAGRRGLLAEPSVLALACSERLRQLVEPHLPSSHSHQPVRAILFDKTPGTNWPVAWHQDLTLALRERSEVVGYGPWSVKEGVPHVQAPAEALAQMLTVRLHLDPCPAENGALRVLPGTHRLGRLHPTQIAEVRAEGREVVCAVGIGDALLMRPLLLHASPRSQMPGRRRVLHLEYAGFPLPAGLAWHEGV